jgi:hypothetical protein
MSEEKSIVGLSHDYICSALATGVSPKDIDVDAFFELAVKFKEKSRKAMRDYTDDQQRRRY